MRQTRPRLIHAVATLTAPAIVAIALLMPGQAHADAVQALSATAFLDAIGVHVHFPPETPNGTAYDNTDNVIRELSYIGVGHVRGGIINDASTLARMQKMTKRLGIKWDLLYALYKGGTTSMLEANIKSDRILGRSVEAFEGVNEPDEFGLQFDGASGAEAVRKVQKTIYDSVKRDPAFKTAVVYGPALSYPAEGGLEKGIGDLSAESDYGASHIYIGNLSLGKVLTYDFIRRWGSFGPRTIAVGRPRVITEAGWPTITNAPEGVDEAIQAKYMLEYLLGAFSQGFSRIYLYELAEGAPDPAYNMPEHHYGLFRNDGTPKPAATALATLKLLLSGSTLSPKTLSYTVSGLPPETGHQVLLQKSDGTFVIALWNEAYLWDPKKHEPIAVGPTDVDVQLATSASLRVVDPLAGTRTMKTLANANAIQLALPDHPIFLFVSPR